MNHFRLKAGQLIVLLIIAFYVINFFTPLRLTNDTIRFFHMKEDYENGAKLYGNGSNDFLPLGYVYFLIGLSKINLLHSFIICFLQFCFLLASIWFIKKIFNIRFWFFLTFILLSWLIIKFVITPLAEMQFLFFSSGALYFFISYQRTKRKILILWLILFVFGAILTRTIGVILIPAFLISLIAEYRVSLIESLKKNIILLSLILIGGIVVIIFSNVIRIDNYIPDFRNALSNYPSLFVTTYLKLHLIDWASVFMNFPSTKLQSSGALLGIIYIIIGAIALVYIIYILLRRPYPLALKLYLLFYLIIMFAWPYFEPRYWMPIIPVLIAIILRTLETSPGIQRIVIIGFLVLYTLTGIASLGYYTFTSLNKKSLAKKQDAARWRNEYEIYFFGHPLSDTAKKVRGDVVEILKKYN